MNLLYRKVLSWCYKMPLVEYSLIYYYRYIYLNLYIIHIINEITLYLILKIQDFLYLIDHSVMKY
jgi:hypothetical protein